MLSDNCGGDLRALPLDGLLPKAPEAQSTRCHLARCKRGCKCHAIRVINREQVRKTFPVIVCSISFLGIGRVYIPLVGLCANLTSVMMFWSAQTTYSWMATLQRPRHR